MEIGLVHSDKDSNRAATREFVEKFVKEHGILATIVETEQPVDMPYITVNGCPITDTPTKIKDVNGNLPAFPGLKNIARALEKSIWCL